MFTICNLFSTLTTKLCEGALKQSQDPKISTTPGFEIHGSATDLKPTDFDHVNSKNA